MQRQWNQNMCKYARASMLHMSKKKTEHIHIDYWPSKVRQSSYLCCKSNEHETYDVFTSALVFLYFACVMSSALFPPLNFFLSLLLQRFIHFPTSLLCVFFFHCFCRSMFLFANICISPVSVPAQGFFFSLCGWNVFENRE